MNLQINSLSYLGAFLGGVAVSFSPCVYPLLPITLGFIGVKTDASSRIRGLFLSLVYVLGMAVTYSVLGLVASLTGKLFGKISAHPVSFLVIGNICILTALSFFDVININFYGINLRNRVRVRGEYLTAFLLGLASGLIAGPCTAPVLGTILVYVASKQNIIYGASLLFVFAYGMGLLLILAGTFGTFILNLRKPEVWFRRLRRICGFILLVAGEYFIIKAGRLM